jgi:glycosyltransferase involved in cell wall biosynthesis
MLIPTDDPQEALEFCRQLTRLVKPTADSRMDAVEAGERPVLSVVLPVFNEEGNLFHLHQRLTATLSGVEPNYELIFVDDGSRDKSVESLEVIAQDDPRVIVVVLARNFGHQVAISAGLDYSHGQVVAIMDADLQDPPEVLPQFLAKWREGYDVVYAIRGKRKESWLLRQAYALFYRLLKRVANINIPLDAGDFCIMDRRVVDLLNGMPERNRFVRGIRSWVGLDQVGLEYERQARHAGQTKYTFSRLLYLAIDGLVSFSFVPLRIITAMGFSISVLSLCLAVFYAIKKILVGLNPPGFATLIVSIFFFAGIQLITSGVIGEYVGRIFEEVKHRPLYVVRGVKGKRA